jgi:hypothetical protein
MGAGWGGSGMGAGSQNGVGNGCSLSMVFGGDRCIVCYHFYFSQYV